MWTLDDIDVDQVETVARVCAAQLGLRPRTQLHYHHHWDQFTAHVRDLRPSGSRTRGSCARARDAGSRHIWVADHPSREQLLETLTHEIAHGLMPWREAHTARWLQLHVASLEAFTGPAHAAAVGDAAAVQYGIRWKRDDPTAPGRQPIEIRALPLEKRYDMTWRDA